jgi:hypothetical protein
MFIKFGDKTKKLVVKKSKEENDDESQDEKTIFLDAKDKGDRRLEILKKYSSEEEKADNKKAM